MSTFHVYGPLTIEWNELLVGQGDGIQPVVVREIAPHSEIPTDGRGGEPADFIQLGRQAAVVLPLIQWDDAQVDEMVAAIDAASTELAPAFKTVGADADVGMMRVADGGYRQLVITGSKATAANGGNQITFPVCFRDPDLDTELTDILGGQPARRLLTMRAMPDDSGNIYTVASVPVP